MNYTRFLTSIANRRKPSIFRDLTSQFLKAKDAISLATGMPNAKMFPFEEIVVTYKGGTKITLSGEELAWSLQYGPTQGYMPLLEKMRQLQEHWHRPVQKHWDVLFTSGSMEACSKVFDMVIDIGDPVMVQVPAYEGILNALAPLLPEFIDIAQDQSGIIPENIENVCEERICSGKPIPKLLYVNPTGANPTGTVLTESRRRRIYELSEIYNFLILEDDPYCFLHFVDNKPMTFLELDYTGRVIRLDSFSKILSPGLRLGVVTAHKEIIQKIARHMETTSMHASSLSQMLLFKFLDTWGVERIEQHFNNVQNFYRERRDIMLSLLEKHLTGLAEWNVPKGGMFVWLNIKGLKDVMQLADKKCLSQGVFLLPGHAFNYDNSKPDVHLRLCYSYATPEEIDKVCIFFRFNFNLDIHSSSFIVIIPIYHITQNMRPLDISKVDTRRNRNNEINNFLILCVLK
ncbi:kynurenine/alpha-aminoadipate aminotransferase, mitochondrial [Xylocopa sonorina]|uniref:kynurenine/alpha-aminoadipate aminotransferase, mitochondrial n=1 Tax=Xylocopa sonorina TaxID=1818115 RepID=UPI00403AFB36